MGVEDEFDEVRKMINRMLQDAVQGKTGPEPEAGSRAYPSHPHPRDELTPVRRYIVQVPPEPGLPGPDVMEDEDSVFVTLELGGRTPTRPRPPGPGPPLLARAGGPRGPHPRR